MDKKTCAVCGAEFTPKRGSKGLCCSVKCGGEYTRLHYSKPKRKAVCQYCGKEFEVGRECKGIYCSKQCQAAGDGRRRHEQAEIMANQKAFIKAANGLVSKRKKEIEDNKKDFIKTAKRMRTCRECGNLFISHNNMRYCSDRCATRRMNRIGDEIKRYSDIPNSDYSITLIKLFKRDKGICKICGRELSMEDHFSSTYYPTIDHIIPISRGGLHVWDNVQLACRSCNSKKGDRSNV